MASHFTVRLDTTSPEIEIQAPNFAVNSGEVIITVKANEELSPEQNFYIVDIAGNRTDLIFGHYGDYFRGIVQLGGLTEGFATFYAQTKDKVNNPSPLVNKVINIVKGSKTYITLKTTSREIIIDNRTRLIKKTLRIRNINTKNYQKNIRISSKVRMIEVKNK